MVSGLFYNPNLLIAAPLWRRELMTRVRHRAPRGSQLGLKLATSAQPDRGKAGLHGAQGSAPAADGRRNALKNKRVVTFTIENAKAKRCEVTTLTEAEIVRDPTLSRPTYCSGGVLQFSRLNVQKKKKKQSPRSERD